MCDPVTIIAAVGSALVAKKVTDDAAKKQENAYKKQVEESNRRAEEANKQFLDQQQAEAINPNLVKKTGMADTGTDQLKVKKTVGGTSNTVGMGGSQGVGLNV